MTVGVLLPTLNAELCLEACLLPIISSAAVNRVLVIDSESSDNTVEVAKSLGAEVIQIRRSEFNHGATREFGRKALGTDIVVMATQDIVLAVTDAVDRLVKPILTRQAEAAYGRQLLRAGADVFEAFPRHFNYPDQDEIRTLADAKTRGVYTFFCSDSFAAYSTAALDQIGGFPRILTNEDYFAVAKLLKEGGRIAYISGAQVIHSHRYTLGQEFRRYFDTGYVRGLNPWVQALVGDAEKRGASFARGLIREVYEKSPALVPYAIVQCAAKWLGFRLGFHSVNAPRWWCRKLSSLPSCWND